jgi:hypothetical protein
VEAGLMLLDAGEQRAQLDRAATLSPGRVHGTEVDAKDAHVPDAWRELEECVA